MGSVQVQGEKRFLTFSCKGESLCRIPPQIASVRLVRVVSALDRHFGPGLCGSWRRLFGAVLEPGFCGPSPRR